jgi:uncharacterized membrane protein
VGTGSSLLTGQAFRLRWEENTIEFIDDSATFEPTATTFLGDVIVGYDLAQNKGPVRQVGNRPIEPVPGSTNPWPALDISSDGHVVMTSDWGSESGGQIVRDGVATTVMGLELGAMNSDGTIVGADRGQRGVYTSVILNETGVVVAELHRAGDQSPVHVTALSADGRVAVGMTATWADLMAEMASDSHAYRWSNGVTELLPEPPGWDGSMALGCDATGNVIVGGFTFPGYLWAKSFVYTPSDGMMDLAGLMTARGLAMPDAFYPISIYVSEDGKVLAGEAVFVDPDNPSPYFSFPWRATLDD